MALRRQRQLLPIDHHRCALDGCPVWSHMGHRQDDLESVCTVGSIVGWWDTCATLASVALAMRCQLPFTSIDHRRRALDECSVDGLVVPRPCFTLVVLLRGRLGERPGGLLRHPLRATWYVPYALGNVFILCLFRNNTCSSVKVLLVRLSLFCRGWVGSFSCGPLLRTPPSRMPSAASVCGGH